jgi:hypothetical protein
MSHHTGDCGIPNNNSVNHTGPSLPGTCYAQYQGNNGVVFGFTNFKYQGGDNSVKSCDRILKK